LWANRNRAARCSWYARTTAQDGDGANDYASADKIFGCAATAEQGISEQEGAAANYRQDGSGRGNHPSADCFGAGSDQPTPFEEESDGSFRLARGQDTTYIDNGEDHASATLVDRGAGAPGWSRQPGICGRAGGISPVERKSPLHTLGQAGEG
jgi:hypothetical protein